MTYDERPDSQFEPPDPTSWVLRKKSSVYTRNAANFRRGGDSESQTLQYLGHPRGWHDYWECTVFHYGICFGLHRALNVALNVDALTR